MPPWKQGCETMPPGNEKKNGEYIKIVLHNSLSQ